MHSANFRDDVFRRAVTFLDSGDHSGLETLLNHHPQLVRERLETPGPWLRNKVGSTLDGYFHQPWLIWFLAENPIRQNTLPANIILLADIIIGHAKRQQVPDLAQTLSYTLGLVCTGRVPRECGVQTELIDLLLTHGAVADKGYGALGGANLEAAGLLIERGGDLTLASALCLDRWDIVQNLETNATETDRQIALAAAAINGKFQALHWLIERQVNLNVYCAAIHPHATPLHHAVCSGSLESVKLLMEAGADTAIRDKVHDGTPIDWAIHEGKLEIAACLRGWG